ncbi:hypothetical protein [Paenibacillus sp. NPDC058071]|uniref:hypothetical protein n=1 Tax=Paenibacillus sp. NPDC058071 TaxID=3346326 RepID=UPI0036D88E89
MGRFSSGSEQLHSAFVAQEEKHAVLHVYDEAGANMPPRLFGRTVYLRFFAHIVALMIDF